MTCQTCNSRRLAYVNGKTADSCFFSVSVRQRDDYVPVGVGIGSGDYLKFAYCLACGQIQGTFPISREAVDAVFPCDGEGD